MKKTVILLILISLCLVLTLDAKTRNQKRLDANLEMWQQFKWQGILQVQVSEFSIRKNFVLAKTSEDMRLDVLDSGVMGLQAKPLVTVYLKDTVVIDAPTVKELANINSLLYFYQDMVKGLVLFADTLQAKRQDILSQRKVLTASTSFKFDKKLRLSAISNSLSGLDIDIFYNNRNQPTKAELKYKGTKFVELQINERTYKNIKIIPLEQVVPDFNLEELLQDIPWEELDLELEE